MALEASELILNDDGSIYHLNLKPEQIADTIITVGDPDRVAVVTSFFDSIEFKTQKREFHTQTGTYKGKRLTVISTGIGTDNIDIVLNELDALANIDFDTRKVKEETKSLTITRIGTSGSLQKEIPLDSFVISEAAIGFDSLLHYYQHSHEENKGFIKALEDHLQLPPEVSTPYILEADKALVDHISSSETIGGITATNVGFYAPQGRILRAQPTDSAMIDKIASFDHEGRKVTNMEMESSAIYALSTILGHKALSANAIIANRATGKFSEDSKKGVKRLINYMLEKLRTV